MFFIDSDTLRLEAGIAKAVLLTRIPRFVYKNCLIAKK